MEVGFTGTHRGMTEAQQERLASLLSALYAYNVGYFHHGDCIGADDQANTIAKLYGYPIYLHPPTDESRRAGCYGSATELPLPYLQRNRRIVDTCDVLIATPHTAHEQLRSGTWATIRYARKRGKTIYILQP